MLNLETYVTQLLSEFTKQPGTETVEVRCSLPTSSLTTTVLDEIKEGLNTQLAEHKLTVQKVHFASESTDVGAKDFFIKIATI